MSKDLECIPLSEEDCKIMDTIFEEMKKDPNVDTSRIDILEVLKSVDTNK